MIAVGKRVKGTRDYGPRAVAERFSLAGPGRFTTPPPYPAEVAARNQPRGHLAIRMLFRHGYNDTTNTLRGIGER